jgi:diguanylate cyclase (GGDEF)-like protein
MMARNLLMVSLLLLCCHTVIVAWIRGSSTARYQAAAWSGLTLVFGISLFHDIVLGRPYTLFLFAMFPALALETVMTAWGILLRLNRLRQDREDARALADAMHQIAHTDPLTGLRNRRAIEQQFALQRPCAIALIDLDLFKQINDRHGHDVGDKVLFATGSALDSGTAVAARIGGEEFLLLLYGDNAAVVREAEMLRQRVTSRVARLVSGLEGPITASLGLCFVRDADDFNAAMKRADLNLYQAKDRGRNCAVVSESALAA